MLGVLSKKTMESYLEGNFQIYFEVEIGWGYIYYLVASCEFVSYLNL